MRNKFVDDYERDAAQQFYEAILDKNLQQLCTLMAKHGDNFKLRFPPSIPHEYLHHQPVPVMLCALFRFYPGFRECITRMCDVTLTDDRLRTLAHFVGIGGDTDIYWHGLPNGVANWEAIDHDLMAPWSYVVLHGNVDLFRILWQNRLFGELRVIRQKVRQGGLRDPSDCAIISGSGEMLIFLHDEMQWPMKGPRLQSLLLDAIRTQKTAICGTLLQWKPDVTFEMLLATVRSGVVEVFDICINETSVSLCTWHRSKLLAIAGARGDLDMIRSITSKLINLGRLGGNAEDPLLAAITASQIDAIGWFTAHDFSFDWSDFAVKMFASYLHSLRVEKPPTWTSLQLLHKYFDKPHDLHQFVRYFREPPDFHHFVYAVTYVFLAQFYAYHPADITSWLLQHWHMPEMQNLIPDESWRGMSELIDRRRLLASPTITSRPITSVHLRRLDFLTKGDCSTAPSSWYKRLTFIEDVNRLRELGVPMTGRSRFSAQLPWLDSAP
jgi:predicted small integral membrane protein